MALNHYVIYYSRGISNFYIVNAASMRDAMRIFCLDHFAVEDEDGNLIVTTNDGYSQCFKSELTAIECCAKANTVQWSMDKIPDRELTWKYSEAFCGINPYDVEYHVENCISQHGEHLRLHYKAYIWYVIGGYMLTFYRPGNGGYITPDAIEYRYLVKWNTDPLANNWEAHLPAVEWKGSSEELYAMLIEEFRAW